MRAVLQEGGSGTVLSPSVGSVGTGHSTGVSECLCVVLSLGVMGVLLTDLRPPHGLECGQ